MDLAQRRLRQTAAERSIETLGAGAQKRIGRCHGEAAADDR
jgi:hypothetical protein